jgi:hypothetical protein
MLLLVLFIVNVNLMLLIVVIEWIVVIVLMRIDGLVDGKVGSSFVFIFISIVGVRLLDMRGLIFIVGLC